MKYRIAYFIVCLAALVLSYLYLGSEEIQQPHPSQNEGIILH